jgi:hypothetical protein
MSMSLSTSTSSSCLNASGIAHCKGYLNDGVLLAQVSLDHCVDSLALEIAAKHRLVLHMNQLACSHDRELRLGCLHLPCQA